MRHSLFRLKQTSFSFSARLLISYYSDLTITLASGRILSSVTFLVYPVSQEVQAMAKRLLLQSNRANGLICTSWQATVHQH